MEKIVLITGASKGIGLATARYLSARGFKVYGGARNPFEEKGINSICLDVTDVQSIKKCVAEVIEKEGRLDVLINNAGMGISGAVEQTGDGDAEYIFNVNFFGAFRMIREALPHLRESRGRIINISSVASPLAIPFQGFYSATKAALDALSCALISEVKPFGVKVTNILPGDTKTEFTGSRRKGFAQNDSVYGERISRSITVMEKDEQNGMPPQCVSKAVYSALKSKRPPVMKTVGLKYKAVVTLAKILPKRLAVYIVGKLYG